ncbi:hypothetical protein BS50DRAFT_579496 [Corynespora cassiicola Philippines]|uniref:CCD97-like C-terminal domain-containing protein n=1 Tax=Corynespora cassiicola Philippines TaxID=1448308 RepID=A0A2T2N3Y8_CORCC|nr:hypothetical protein BS50DRAFT_579496 [Corynespora cassiicola Philippines]
MPYLTGSPTMVPLVFRPSNNAPESAVARLSLADANNDVDMDGANGNDDILSRDDDAIRDHMRDAMRQAREERAQDLKAKNRRKRYLEVHPEYFQDLSLELADPLLYDRLIRRFQSAAEREEEGRRRGFSGQMHADLWRAEAKKDALANPNPDALFAYRRGPEGQIVEEANGEGPKDKAEGKAWWVDEMTQRFLSGRDTDFDYKTVDGNEKYDDPEEERDIQDAYFDSMDSDFDTDGEGKEKMLTGETGIQDY